MSQSLFKEDQKTDLEVYQLIILILSVFVVELYFCSPGISYYLYFKGKIKTKFLPSATIFVNLVNCILWVILGLNRKPYDFQMLFTNSIGFVISLIWIVIFWVISSKNNLVASLIHLFNVFNIIFQIFYILLTLYPNSPNISQAITIAINVMMYISTAQNMWQAIKLRQPFLLPSFSCFCGLFCSCGFVTYGALINDEATMISNAVSVGVLVPIVLVWAILKYLYKNVHYDPKDDDDQLALIQKIKH